ncbi:MAG: LamG-like jellyroll fold domain-containing protein [Candidatus Thorarchaeota archaeon SMTZ1-83]|nr:MAG: hypothetical protein AM324_03475 [Candidatus Thorarchaeota archaeon SMTZ1-83]
MIHVRRYNRSSTHMTRIVAIGMLLVLLIPTPFTQMTNPAWIQEYSAFDTIDTVHRQSAGNSYTGSGVPRIVRLTGQMTSQSTLHLDHSTSAVAGIVPPSGWSADSVSANIEGLFTIVDDVLFNGRLNDHHLEKWLGLGYNAEDVWVPDGWTLTVDEQGPGSGRSGHPTNGLFEFNNDSASGYDDTMGWILEAVWSSGNELTAEDEVYLSQTVSVLARSVLSAEVNFLYRPWATCDLEDQTHLFVRLAGHETKLHVLEPGDPLNTWLEASVTIPSEAFESLSTQNALQLDIGLGTDLAGAQSEGRTTRIFIDEVKLTLNIAAFPEQVGLMANGTVVSSYRAESIIAQVPDDEYISGVSGRDCRSWPSVGVHLEGLENDGVLDVGVWGNTGWNDADAYQIAFQFPADIPQGAIVTSARLEIEGDADAPANRAGMRIHVADEDLVNPFTAGFPVLRDRFQWVDTSADWYPSGTWVGGQKYLSPDFAGLVQKVVSRPGWISGNYMCIMLDYAGSAGYQDYNNARGSSHFTQSELARLYVDFVVPEEEDTVSSLEFQKNIIIDHTRVTSDLVDFPVLLDFYDTDLRTDVQPDCDDIAFAIDGEPLAYEIESFDQTYNSTHAHFTGWVGVPYLSSTADTVITMYYGNPMSGNGESPSGVWGQNYVGVWHLDESSGTVRDSSTYGGTGIPRGGVTQAVAGKVGDAYDFDGIDAYVDFGDPIDGHLDFGTGSFTISLWLKINASTGTWQVPLNKGHPSILESGYRFETNTAATNMYFQMSDGISYETSNTQSPTMGAWMHLVARVDRSSNDLYLFKDGSYSGSVDISGIGNIDSPEALTLSRGLQLIASIDGGLDEVRMSDTALTDDWIATEYNNQYDPSSFITVGNEMLTVDGHPANLRFSTSHLSPVTLDVSIELKVASDVDSLDKSLSPGTSFSADNGSLTTWTALIPVTPPEGVEEVGFSISYPQRDWGPISVVNPSGATKTEPADWVAQWDSLIVPAAAVDEYGIWKVEFLQDTSIFDLQVGPSGGPMQNTASFSVNDEMEFLATIPQLDGERTTFVLTDPSGAVWHSATNTTSGGSLHEIPSFRYRKDIVIDHTQVDGNLIDFPVFIDISDSDLRNTDRVQPDGDDILFVSNGIVLAHEIEIFNQTSNSTHARLVAWVKANLSSTVDTTIAMYYGNPIVGSQENPSEVWTSDFVGVWHLDESLSGVEGEIVDSTSYDNDGYSRGSMDSTDSIPAKLGTGIELDGIDDFLVVPDSLSLDSVVGRGTLEAWVNWQDSSDGRYQRIMVSSNRFAGPSTAHNDGFEWGVQPEGDNFFYPWGGDQPNYNMATNPFTNGIWHRVTITLDYSSKEVKLYLDGNLLTWTSENVPTYWVKLASLDDWFWGGTMEPYHRGDQCMAGMFDEIRVSDVVRSAEWIATEYSNQNDPDGFYALGSEMARPTTESSILKVVDSSADQGLWTVSSCYNATGPIADYATSLYQRQFIVSHNSTLALSAPSDAIGDGLSVRVVGSLLFVEVDLKDEMDSDPVLGATVNVNWTVSGVPTQVQLDDYGTGSYGKALNTSDLENLGRWRVEISSYHPFFNNATLAFDLDILHTTAIEYASPPPTPYGDDFAFNITLRDGFDATLVPGATITSNGTVEGITDHGDGTYLVTLDASGLGIGSHYFELYADPLESYLLDSSTIVCLTIRDMATDAATGTTDPPNVPWGHTVNATLQRHDSDHSNLGISGGTVTGDTGFDWTDLQDGNYSIRIEMSAYTPGVYLFNFTISKAYYQSADVTVAVNVVPHRTYIVATYNSSVPLGADMYVSVQYYDLDEGGSIILDNFTQIVAQWLGGSSNHGSREFWLQTDSWGLGSHPVNLTLESTNSPRLYYDAMSAIVVNLDKLTTELTWDHVDMFPIGDDFEIFLNLSVNNPESIYHGNPVNGLDTSYFSAEDHSGSPYTIEGLTPLGGGSYSLTIDQATFLEGNYTIRIFLSFGPAENYGDVQTPLILFSYRWARSQLTSPDYPLATMAYSTDITLTLLFEDVDRAQGITGASIVPEGASIVTTQDLGTGEYRVILDTSGWNQGLYNVNLTASATDYASQTISIDINVREIRTYAVPTVGTLNIPVGDSSVFFVDYVDMDNDAPIDSGLGLCNWTGPHYTVEWVSTRYRVTINTFESDALGSYLLMFNFTKGPNIEAGYFKISLTIRTIDTEFRLVAPVAPTTPAGTFYISVYYGDKDHNAGIVSALIDCTVANSTGIVNRFWTSGTVAGYYEIEILASEFGGLGTQHLTVYFNWTGGYQKYHNMSIALDAEIVGEASSLTLIDASLPSPCPSNMSYTFLYAGASSGTGITNQSGNVFVSVNFMGAAVDLSEIQIWETDRVGQPGYYSVRFNTTILGGTGLFSMNVFINWSKGVSPYYTNRTDTISVRVLPRDTLLSVVPPTPVRYGENATFSFTYEDVTGGGSDYIDYSQSVMTVAIGVPDFSITYDSFSGIYSISFNTSQFGSPLGERTFALNVTWAGIPFYANVTGRLVAVTLKHRQTSLTYPTPPSTPYGDNLTFAISFDDVTGTLPRGLEGVTVTLYDDTVEIPATYSTISELGGGNYKIELDTNYFAQPGDYDLKIRLESGLFYIEDVEETRTLPVTYRNTILVADPVGLVQFNNSMNIVIRYLDLTTLGPIANQTGARTWVEVLNGTDWILSCMWRPGFGDYLLIVDTYNQPLSIGTPYVLTLNFSFDDTVPFYEWSTIDVPFQLGERSTILDLDTAPLPTPYLDYSNFTVVYRDLDSLTGVVGASIQLSHGAIPLVESVDYLIFAAPDGYYTISVLTSGLGTPGPKAITVEAVWTSGSPFYGDAMLDVSMSVTKRPANVEVIVPPSYARYLDNVTFEFAYVDMNTGGSITVAMGDISIYSGGALLASGEYSLRTVSSWFEVSINSTVLDANLVSNWNVTVFVQWDGSAPYYTDDSTLVSVTTTKRRGTVGVGQVMPSPMGDNLTLSLSFRDESTGLPIVGASVQFSCVEEPALVENVDYWIESGSGAEAGNYMIYVGTASLGAIGDFTFIIDLNWNPTTSPYYEDVTNIVMAGEVRLISTLVVSELPLPSVVPFFENVSYLLDFNDTDHHNPIDGAEGSIHITYNSTGLEPLIWSVRPLGDGQYNITVNVTEALNPAELQVFVIIINHYPYREARFNAPFQVRSRIAVLSGEVGAANYAGYSTSVLVNITDFDANDAPLSGATLDITWGDSSSWIELGNGLYNITLDTTDLSQGTQTLIVDADLQFYSIQPLTLSVNLLSVPTELIVTFSGPNAVPTEIYWGQPLTIFAAYNDTLRNQLIAFSSVTYNWTGGFGTLAAAGVPGNYTAIIDTSTAASSPEILIKMKASKANYHSASSQIVFRLLARPMDIISSGNVIISIPKGDPAALEVSVQDGLDESLVTDALLYANWTFGNNLNLTPVLGQPGYYNITLNTDQVDIEIYQVVISASRNNYIDKTIALTISVQQIKLEIEPDSLTETYASTAVYWSQVVRIGVYVTEGLNNTGISACDVTWNSPELGANGTLVNGTALGGPGYFYFDFNTTTSTATTHTFIISAIPHNDNDYQQAQHTVLLFVQVIQTYIDSPGAVSLVWGWDGFINFTFWDMFHNTSIDDAESTYQWAGGSGTPIYRGNGVYSVPVNTTPLAPGTPYTLSISFVRLNYKPDSVSIQVILQAVPTEAFPALPSMYYVDGSITDLQIPLGDVVTIPILYNDTYNGLGIPGATIERAVYSGPGFYEENLTLYDDGLGNYAFDFDTRLYAADNSFEFTVTLSLENRSTAHLTFYARVIEIPTSLTLEGSPLLSLVYGDIVVVEVQYSDTWPGHSVSQIVGATISVEGDLGNYIQATDITPVSGRPGWYAVTFVAGTETGSVELSIFANRTDYASQSVGLVLTISPSEEFVFMQTMVSVGSAAAVALMLLGAIWVRILRVPKLVRKLSAMIRQLRRGKIPKPDTSVMSRHEMVVDMFNEVAEPAGVKRRTEGISAEAVTVEVPEIETMIVDLAILTAMSPEELEEFRMAISKMKLSEQTTFAREVIQQEAVQAAQQQGVSVEEVLDGVLQERMKRLGADSDTVKKPLAETYRIHDSKAEAEEAVAETLSDDEIQKMKKELLDRGLPEHEIDSVIGQARKLPKEVGEMLLKGFAQSVEIEEEEADKDFLSEKELQELREQLKKDEVSPREIDNIIEQARAVPRTLAMDLLKGVRHEQEKKRRKRRPAKPVETLSDKELRELKRKLEEKGTPEKEIQTIMREAEKVPRDVAERFLKEADKMEPFAEEKVEFEDRLSEMEVEKLRAELVKRGLPPPEIEAIVSQAKNLPSALVDDLLRSIDADKKD